jgi:hypothetical protein
MNFPQYYLLFFYSLSLNEWWRMDSLVGTDLHRICVVVVVV